MAVLTSFEANIAQALGYSSVYFIVRLGADADAPCKVGIANNPNQRKHDLQISSPEQLTFADVIFVRWHLTEWESSKVHCIAMQAEDYDEGMAPAREIMEAVSEVAIHPLYLERQLHQRFDELGLRIRGEWFAGGHARLVEESKKILQEEYEGRDYLSLRSMRRKIRCLKDEAAIKQRPPRPVARRRTSIVESMEMYLGRRYG